MSLSDPLRPPRTPREAGASPGLKAQAIALLSRREHSRQELRAKLLELLRKRGVLERAAQAAHAPPSNGIDDAFMPPGEPLVASAPAPEAAVDQLLDWLAAHHYLSEARFVESRVNARARKHGALRIQLELSRHGLVLAPEQAAALRETEFARAQALWQRKFGECAPDGRVRAKQARFRAARGFAADVVRRVVGGLDED